MFLRFVTTRVDEDSHKPQGVFVAAHSLLDSGDLTADEWARMREILNWFNNHLPHPPEHFDACRAIFWFKSSATDSVEQVWELIEMLRQHNRYVEVHKCRRLANIRYQDRFQVAAYHSKLDGRITFNKGTGVPPISISRGGAELYEPFVVSLECSSGSSGISSGHRCAPCSTLNIRTLSPWMR